MSDHSRFWRTVMDHPYVAAAAIGVVAGIAAVAVSAVVTSVVSTPVVSNIIGNAANGLKFEKYVLRTNNLVKNTKLLNGTRPDSMTGGIHEVKGVKYLSQTGQIQRQIELAKTLKTSYTLHVKNTTNITKTLLDTMTKNNWKIPRY